MRAWVAAAEISPAGGTCPGAPVPSFVACHRRQSLRPGPRESAVLYALVSEPGVRSRGETRGPILALVEFTAWEGTVRSQESWLIRQIPAWRRVRMLWAPVPRHRPEAVVARPGRCSGASRSSLRTPWAGRLALRTLSPTSPWRTPSSSCQLLEVWGGAGAVCVPWASLALGLVGRQTLPSVSPGPPTPSRDNQKLESATGACSPVGPRASRPLPRSCARRLVCESWECPWHHGSHPRAHSPFPRNGVLLCRG